MLSLEDVEALLGPNGFVLAQTLPSACWWFLGMAMVLVAMSFLDLGSTNRDKKSEGTDIDYIFNNNKYK